MKIGGIMQEATLGRSVNEVKDAPGKSAVAKQIHRAQVVEWCLVDAPIIKKFLKALIRKNSQHLPIAYF